MSKVPWINFKRSDFGNIQELLAKSYQSNQLTNGGPLVSHLENFFHQKLQIKDSYSVIAVTNGALGLYCLVNGINMTEGYVLRYATQAFTFPCANQGPCQNSEIIDIDPLLYTLDVNQIPTDVNGIIVTNLFGNSSPIENFLYWAEENQKVLIFDNATTPFTFYKGSNVNNYGDGSIISLHHTKILGMAEGGLIIAKKKYESNIRKCINFGFHISEGSIRFSPLGINAKMSEPSAAFILDYISRNFDKIIDHQLNIYCQFKDKIRDLPVKLFPDYSNKEIAPFVSCFALIFNRKITNDDLQICELSGITARKYYTPLKDLPVSKMLFDHILCLPCHLEVDGSILDRYVNLIKLLLNQ